MAINVTGNAYVLGLYGSGSLFGGSSTDTTPVIQQMDLSALALPTHSVSANATPSKRIAPTPPWQQPAETPAQISAAVTSALAGHSLINENAAQLDLQGASADYKKLFALYQGLTTLTDLANRATQKGLSPTEQGQVAKAFAAGLAEVNTYVAGAKFDNLRLADGTASSIDKTTLSVPKPITSYTTAPVTKSITDEVPAYQGNVQFSIAVKRLGVTSNVAIDLSNMGSTPRTIGNVVNYINTQLAATGVATRFATERSTSAPNTITVGGKTVTLGPGVSQWALKVNVGTSETVTFGAPQTAGAVYVAQTVGDPNPDKDPTTKDSVTQQQLLKFQTDTTSVDAPPQQPGQANFVDNRVFANTLGPEVKAVHATQVAADGSVYMLADITGATAGQSIRGTQDTALLKYDSAGKLIYSRTLGAAGSASGLGLALSADGHVAVTGSVTGALDGTVDGALNSGGTGSFATSSDSFVSLYDASGQEVWTERRGSRLNDEGSQATFGADGTLYVAGRAQGQMPGAGAPIGGMDGYIEAFKTDAAGKPSVAFTQTFGTSAEDKPQGLVVSGNTLYTAGVENGHAIVRSFDVSSGTAVAGATRDLGDLQGGSIAGIAMNGAQLVVAGSTSNGVLNAGTPGQAASGGSDAFVASISGDLSSQASDSLNYYGGAGDDRVTSMAVANGQVWIGGQAGASATPGAGANPPDAPLGTIDGFLASIDPTTGAVGFTSRFTGKDNMAVPSAIAVAPTGASVLDRLGLPSGTLTLSDSQQLSAQSSLRPGDQFTVQGGTGVKNTVTIAAGETLQTLATKITRASGFNATVTVTTSLDGKRQISIVPVNPRATVTIGAGPGDKNALPLLGIPEGVLRTTNFVNNVSVPGDGGARRGAHRLQGPGRLQHAAERQGRSGAGRPGQRPGAAISHRPGGELPGGPDPPDRRSPVARAKSPSHSRWIIVTGEERLQI
jgi:hypothetical protein